jgi:hypothetical protein
LVLDAVSSSVSIETAEHAHDPAQRDSDRDDDELPQKSDGDDRQIPEGGDEQIPPEDDELLVVVCPQGVYERLRPELDESREQLCRRYEREYEDLLAERAQLADEIDCLERQLARKESQLDAVVTRNERILEARTESYRRRIVERNADDDVQWTGRTQTPGLLDAVKNWLR